MGKRITLVVPGLAGSGEAPASIDGMPGLDWLLRRAAVVAVPADLEALTWQRAGGTDSCPATAPVTRLADTGRSDSGWWLRADPVCLVAGVADATLLTKPGPSDAQTAQLSATIRQHLGGEDYSLEAPTVDRWYLRCPTDMHARTLSPDRARHSGVAAALPSGPAGPRLCALMTEMQMLLHEHSVNRGRESRGLPPVNAVWLWGGGRIPAPPLLVGGRSSLFAHDPYARGLWALAGDEAMPVPGTVGDLVDHAGDQIVVFDDGPGTAPAELDRAWIAPLVAQVRAGAIDSVEIIDAGVSVVLEKTSRPGWLKRLGGALLRNEPTRWPWST